MVDWDTWENKKAELKKNLQPAKEEIVREHKEFLETPKGMRAQQLGRSFFSAIPAEMEELIQFYVVDDNPHAYYKRSETLDETGNCLLIKHELLDEYVGKYHSEIFAAKEFLDPNLEIKSATFVRYLSNESFHVPDLDADYVIEHVFKGEMHVLYDNTPDYMRLGMYRPLLAHAYRPGIDPPKKKMVYKDLETVVFTYH
jgi:hypothetical protein